MKFTLDRKILAGFITCTIVLLVVATISFKNSEQLIETNHWVNHTYEVLSELEQVQAYSVDAETGERGYIITGESNYLEPFNDAKSKLLQHLNKVKELTVDNPSQQAKLNTLEPRIDTLIAHLETCIELRKTKGFPAAQKALATGFGKITLDDIRVRLASSKEMEDSLLVIREKASNEDAHSFSLVFISLIVIIVVVLVIVYLIISSNLKALRKAEQETAEKNWTLSGSGELVKNMQGNKQLTELVQVTINHLARYLNAQIGALYVMDDSEMQLTLIAGYAIDKMKRVNPIVKFGEGIIGQCASERKGIFLDTIPDDYFVIDTGIGDIRPRNIIAVPLIFEDSVVGVIELGSTNTFTQLQKQYLDIVLDSISIGITSAKARETMKTLLEETQRQAEELETQQEELRQTNEELQEKTVLLERSEAELKAQQEELQQSNEELEEKANLLEEQKERLESAKMELENKARELEITSKYKSEFLSNMSHELRTPLNSILILAQLLSENKTNHLDDKEKQFAKNICSSGNDLLNLINEILDLSKVEAGKIEMDIAEIEYSELVSDLQNMFDEVAKNKAINFNIRYDKGKAPTDKFVSDKQRVEQVLKNLLSNAFKFTDKNGEVTLQIGRVGNNIRFSNQKLKNTEEVITFSVIDNGIGIPFDKQSIVFEAFQQADGSTKRKYGGTGLGLSISRELANALGGEIHLESKEGKGSTFTFYLPLKYDTTNEITPSINPPNPPVRKEKVHNEELRSTKEVIPLPDTDEEVFDDRYTLTNNDRVVLIIEDDIVFAKVLFSYVHERNYKGIIATQGNTGLSFARFYRPDAIILDMNLPVMNGEEILKLLKNSPDLRHIPVQIISGYDKKKLGLELGAFDYITKPVQQNDLKQAFDDIEDFISRKVKKLLVVEDNDDQNRAIRELIGNNDVKCFSAYSGSEAFQMLEKDKYDCIIVDLGLPDMLGFELLEKIKSTPSLNTIPIIVYTGRDLKNEETRRLNKLADTVVLKTVHSHERLLDETTLFLHRIESKLPKEKQSIIRKLHKTDEVLKDKKVLLVDDDIRNIYSLSSALEAEGIQCVTAENGKIALRMLKENPDTDIILMDVMMPEMDGYEATREIRNMSKFEKMPIIAITAKAMKGDREKCLAAGMSDFIAKPVNLEQLLSLMRVWLYK